MDAATAASVLGVAVGSPLHVVRRAWRERVKASHPDHAGGDLAAFAAAMEAFKVLSDGFPAPSRSTGAVRIDGDAPFDWSAVSAPLPPPAAAATAPPASPLSTPMTPPAAATAGRRPSARASSKRVDARALVVLAGCAGVAVAARVAADLTGAWPTAVVATVVGAVCFAVAGVDSSRRWWWAAAGMIAVSGFGVVYLVCVAAAVSVWKGRSDVVRR